MTTRARKPASVRLAERNDILSVLKDVDGELSKFSQPELTVARRYMELVDLRYDLCDALLTLGFEVPFNEKEDDE